MTDCVYDGSSEFDGEFTEVQEWEAEYDYPESDSGLEYCDVNDIGDDIYSGEALVTGVFSTSRSTPYSGFEREGIHSFAYPNEASPWYLVQSAPYDTAHQGTNYNYNSDSQFNSRFCDDESCSMKYGTSWDECDNFDTCNGFKNEVDAGFYERTNEFVNGYVSASHYPSYTPATYLTHHTHLRHRSYQFPGHHPTSHSLRRQPRRSSRPAPYVPPHLRLFSTQRHVLPSYHNTSQETYTTRMKQVPQDLNCQGMNYYQGSLPNSDFEHWHDSSNYSAAATTGYYYDDEMHECSDHLRMDYADMSGYIEHEIDFRDVKPKEGVRVVAGIVSEACVDSDIYRPPHNIAGPLDNYATLELMLQENASMRQQVENLRQAVTRLSKKQQRGLSTNKEMDVSDEPISSLPLANLVGDADFQIDRELEQQENNLVLVTSNENEGKTEPSIGLKAAMRCLELQKKFWGIGRLFSVIPAAPIVQIIDPFLAEFELKSQYHLLKIEPLDLNSMRASKEQEFLGMRRSNLRFAAWAEWFRAKEADVILYDWFGIWRPPDSVFQYWRLGSNMVDFWVDKGRPLMARPASLCPPHSFEVEAL